jgi:uncharacterized phage-associated protein
MTARLDSVCKFICNRSGWTISNLQLQKILYMAQMYHMGRHEGERLVETHFEAWDYGPVSPLLYRKVRMFGASPIEDVFYEARSFKDGDERKAELFEVCDSLLPMRPGALVDLTHRNGGAWANNYVPGVRGIVIPDGEIADEFHSRLREPV